MRPKTFKRIPKQPRMSKKIVEMLKTSKMPKKSSERHATPFWRCGAAAARQHRSCRCGRGRAAATAMAAATAETLQVFVDQPSVIRILDVMLNRQPDIFNNEFNSTFHVGADVTISDADTCNTLSMSNNRVIDRSINQKFDHSLIRSINQLIAQWIKDPSSSINAK